MFSYIMVLSEHPNTLRLTNPPPSPHSPPHSAEQFGLIRSRRVVNGMRAVSILITELLIKTPWYTDQRSMPPSWREPSSPSPWIWRGRSFFFFCPIQEHKVPNVNTTELLMQKQGNLFLLLCLLSFINFQTSGLYAWIYPYRTGCCEHCKPLSLCTTTGTHPWNLSHFQSLFLSHTLWNSPLLQALPKVAWQMPMSPTVTNMSHSECFFLSPDRAALTSQRGKMHKLNHASRSSPSLISLSSFPSISPHLFICYLFYFSSLTAL